MVIYVVPELNVKMWWIDQSLNLLRTLREVVLMLKNHHILVVWKTYWNRIRRDRKNTNRLIESDM